MIRLPLCSGAATLPPGGEEARPRATTAWRWAETGGGGVSMASAKGGNPDIQMDLRNCVSKADWEEPDWRRAVLGSPRPSSPGWPSRPPHLVPPQLTAALSRRQLISSLSSTRRSDQTPICTSKRRNVVCGPARLQTNITHTG